MAPDRRRGDAQPHGGRRDRGSSVIELTLYMPILMLCVFVAVQFSLTYLGNQVVSSVARETARAVRQGADQGQANAVAVDYAHKIGSGVISNLSVTVVHPDADTVRVRVTADTLHLVSIDSLSRVSAEVQGPLETFRPDTGG